MHVDPVLSGPPAHITAKRPALSWPHRDLKMATGLPIAFLNGALRITRTPGRHGNKNCVNLGDLIHKHELVSACVYAFDVKRDELFRYLPLSSKSNRVPVGAASLLPTPAGPRPRLA